MVLRVLLGLLISSCSADFVLAQTTSVDALGESKRSEIEQRLDQERDMLFNDATLMDVKTFLEMNGIPVYLDERGLDDIGLAVDTPITFRHNSIRLRDGLNLLLKQLDLGWMVQHGRVVITNEEETENQLITRVYDVRNLLEPVPVLRWNGDPLGRMTTVYQYDFDTLINTIRSAVAPVSWDFVGGPGSIDAYYTRRMRVIVVSQTYDVHRQLEALLKKLADHGGHAPLPAVPAYLPPEPSRSVARSPFVGPPGARQTIHASQLRMTGE
jgi:hypothetical protein